MPILIVGDNGSGTDVVIVSYPDAGLPDVVDVADVASMHPNAAKVLFVLIEPSRPLADPEEPGTNQKVLDPEPTFTAAQIKFNKLRRRLRKLRRAHLLALENGQSGTVEHQKDVNAAGVEMTIRVLFGFPMPIDEIDEINIENPVQQLCSGAHISAQHDNGFEVTATSTAAGTCGIKFDWSVTWLE